MRSKTKDFLITVRPEVYVILAASALILPLGWVAAWITAATVHEFFHYIALKVCRCKINRIQIGANGAVIDTDAMSYGEEAVCAAAGPLAGLFLLFIAKWIPKIAICALIQSTYNLLPVFPMDGGRIIRSLLRKWFDLCLADRICGWIENILWCILGLTCLYLTLVASLGQISVIWLAMLILKNKFANRPCKDRLLRVQ